MLQCAVRRLHVAAASEPAARRFVTTLEDALRCATLPGDDRRVVVVRRLALGRVAHDAGTQRLGLLIEQRLARGEIAWAGVDAPPDPRADVVGFAGVLEVRVLLARRLVQGASCEAWYWPLAVPEWRRAPAPRDALRSIAQAIAALPQARVALPEWIAQVVDAGGVAPLCAAIDERLAHTLLRDAGIAAAVEAKQADAVAAPVPAADEPSAPAAARSRRSASPAPSRPAWLSAVLARTSHDERRRATPDAPPATRNDPPGEHAASGKTPAPLPAPMAAFHRDAMPERPPRPPSTLHARTAPARAEGAPPAPATGLVRPRVPATAPSLDGDWRTTACGGLLFLLPVLARAGLVPGVSPEADRLAALGVLHAALRRVRAADDDPAWALVTDLSAQRPAASCDECAQHDLAAARRWLHRHARLGLAALVRRPARLALTPTHVDVRFALATADVHVRRLGLDVDPGWLPWFGRVIAFHFVAGLP